MPKITNLPADPNPTTDDYIVSLDSTTGQTKKVLLSDIATAVASNIISAKVTKSTDAAGWVVYNFTTFSFYRKELAANTAVTNGQRTKVGTVALPSSATIGNCKIMVSWEGNYSGHATPGAEVGSSSGWDIYLGNEYSGGPLTFVGNVRCLVLQT